MQTLLNINLLHIGKERVKEIRWSQNPMPNYQDQDNTITTISNLARMLLKFHSEQSIKIPKEKIRQDQVLMKLLKLIKKEWKLAKCLQLLEEISFKNLWVKCQDQECIRLHKSSVKEFLAIQFQESIENKRKIKCQGQALTIAKIQFIKIKVHLIEWEKVAEELLSIIHNHKILDLEITRERIKYLEIVVLPLQWHQKKNKNIRTTILDLEVIILIQTT